MASTYVAVTADDSVNTKEEVIVQETASVEQITNHTLSDIDGQISSIDAELADLNARKTALQALRVDIDTEAGTVSLAT